MYNINLLVKVEFNLLILFVNAPVHQLTSYEQTLHVCNKFIKTF